MRIPFILSLGAGLLCLLLGTAETRAQEHATLHPDTPPGIALGKTAAGLPDASAVSGTEAESEASEEISYVPKIDGAVKAKFELSTYDGEFRFNVRNSRFGVSGNVSRHMIYRMQVDFSNEGKVSILDAYAGYQAGRWDVRLGQQQYHFSSDLDRGPSSNMFANRSFLAKYLTGYYGSELVDGKPKDFVRTLGSRDLGIMATYTFQTRLPLKFYFGIFNGSGINNPEWGKTVNFVGRAEIGPASEGLRLALKAGPDEIISAVTKWMAWAQRCRIPSFRELRLKIKRHFGAIVASAKFGISNARVEATNNKIKLLIRTAYGFRNTDSLVSMIMLSCSCVQPRLPGR